MPEPARSRFQRLSSRLRRGLSVGACLLLMIGPKCGRGEAVVESPEEREAEEIFVSYLQLDTSNPPGRETVAARYLKSLFDKEGIEAGLVGSDPDRQSVWARLRADRSDEPALLLLHHLDVVPAMEGDWTVPPFSGERSNGYIWGRGALDVKSLGVAHFMAMVDLVRSGAELRRDVVFLGVADEEAGGRLGAEYILDEHADLLDGVGFVINEGGANEVVVDRVAFWGIEIDQKIPLWIRLTAHGERGHGSVPPDDGGSAARLVSVLSEIVAIERPYALTPTVDRYFRALAETKKGRKQELLSNPAASIEAPDIEEALSAGYRSLLSDTLAITRIEAGTAINILPSEAVADIDIRVLPGRSVDAMEKTIRDIAGDRADVEVLLRGDVVEPSPLETSLFDSIRRVALSSEPDSKVGPLVSPGTTDCRYFRERGMVCYGFSPFKVNYYDGDDVHGVDEKMRARFFAEGVRVMRGVVRDFCVEARPAE